jgi:hypothetical protein
MVVTFLLSDGDSKASYCRYRAYRLYLAGQALPLQKSQSYNLKLYLVF